MQSKNTIGYFRLLRQNPAFRNLWYGQVVSELGDWLNSIAIYALILKLSDSGMAMAGAMMAKLLPIVLVSPIAGVVVDRVSRKTVMIISDLLRCGVVLGFLLVEDQNTLWLVYALVIVEISLSGFFEPARSAIIPSLVPKKDLAPFCFRPGSFQKSQPRKDHLKRVHQKKPATRSSSTPCAIYGLNP